MSLTEQIRFVASEQDKALLDLISEQDGSSGMSATIRRLIRDEAKRRGIETVSQDQPQPITNQ